MTERDQPTGQNPSISEMNIGLPNMNLLQVVKALRQEEWRRPWIAGDAIKKMLEAEGQPMVEELGRAPLPTEYGDWTYITFGDYTNGYHHEMLVFGNEAEGSTVV